MKIYGCILAAGLGSRLGEYTESKSKWLIEVNGISLAYRYLKAFWENNIQDLYVVTGHASIELIGCLEILNEEFNLNINYINNDLYKTTNNIYSLDLALKKIIKTDFQRLIIAECDLFISEEATNGFLSQNKGNHLLASPYQYWMDGSCISAAEDGKIQRLYKKNEIPCDNYSNLYKTVNWYSFDKDYVTSKLQPFISVYNSKISVVSYYELVIKILLEISEIPINLYLITPSHWLEIDDVSDLSFAECLDDGLKGNTDSLVSRYGGFWKFPWLRDLTLLVNPYFPDEKMKKELSSLTSKAIVEYPSSQNLIAKLVSKTLSISDKEIIVGNGVCELMLNLLPKINGKFEIISPFFLEYKSILGESLITLEDPEDYSWKNNIILVNPNNPDGKVIELEKVLEISKKIEKNNKFLIYDESFSDFYHQNDISFLNSNILKKYKNVIVLKSFGKTYGIPGLRLGLMANGNQNRISEFRKYLPIWNINSMAEIFLDLLPRYKNEYLESTLKISKVAKNFYLKFEEINPKKIYVYKPNANFLLIEFYKEKDLVKVRKKLFEEGFIAKSIIKREGLPDFCLRIAVQDHVTNNKVASVIIQALI